MINYYNKCIPNLSGELHCLYELTKEKVRWSWGKEHSESFQRSKRLVNNIKILTHYDPTKKIIVSADASPYGAGGVLSHVIDGVERPVMFASSTLSAAERNYSQLHREALAIIFAVKKFHKYIFGFNFTIHSDHQPLRAIFGERKNISGVAANRLQRWAIFLSMYSYDIKYKKAKDMANADALSRLSMGYNTGIEYDSINSLNTVTFPLMTEDVKEAMKNDSCMTQVYNSMLTGKWPIEKTEEIQKYYLKRESLATENGCLFYGDRIVIPSTLRNNVLKLIHDQHIGIVRSKALARTVVWWPGIDQDIENFNKKCDFCQSTQNAKPANLSKWIEATYPFERIHIDFCSLNGHQILILYDAYSKWMEAIPFTTATAAVVNEKLRSIFFTFGLPFNIVSDNGPPFSSREFLEFLKFNGIVPLKSPPYHPQSNGSAERAVQTFKNGLRKSLLDQKEAGKSLQLRIDQFFLKYRTTPTSSTGLTPGEMIFRYKPRTLLNVLNSNKPNVTAETNSKSVESNIRIKHRSKDYQNKLVHFKVGEEVWYRNVFSNFIKWVKGKVVSKLSSYRYMVLVNGIQKQAHTDQLRKNKNDGMTFVETREGLNETTVESQSNIKEEEGQRIVTRSMAEKVKSQVGGDFV